MEFFACKTCDKVYWYQAIAHCSLISVVAYRCFPPESWLCALFKLRWFWAEAPILALKMKFPLRFGFGYFSSILGAFFPSLDRSLCGYWINIFSTPEIAHKRLNIKNNPHHQHIFKYSCSNILTWMKGTKYPPTPSDALPFTVPAARRSLRSSPQCSRRMAPFRRSNAAAAHTAS